MTRFLVTLLVAALLVPLGSGTVAAAPSSTTYVTAFSDRGDWVGDGSNHVWLGTDQVEVAPDACCAGAPSNGVNVSASQGGEGGTSIHLTFLPPPGETLTTGVYDGAIASRGAGSDDPGIYVKGSLLGFSDDRYCEGLGKFVIHDIAPDFSRLWLTYEQRCYGMPEGIFGEIRYQQPSVEGDLLVAPGRIDWPDAYRNAPAHRVPVTLVNTGAAPVRVTSASVVQGAGQFSVSSGTCGTVAAGDSCVLHTGFRPTSEGPHRGLLRIKDSSGGAARDVPLSGGTIPGHTSWHMVSDEGDYIGDGYDRGFVPTSDVIWAYPDLDRIALAVNYPALDGDGWWDALFAAPPGEELRPGTTYRNVMRAPFRDEGHAGLDVYGVGRGCNRVGGYFHLRELTVEDDMVTSFAATFEQHCENEGPALYGSVAWRAREPAAPVPVRSGMGPTLSIVGVPRIVTDRDRVTIGGTLRRGAKNPLEDRLVVIEERPRGGGAWRAVTSTRTRASGSYTARVTSQRSSDYRARFAGDLHYGGATSRSTTVQSRWRVGLRGPARAGPGKVRLRGTVVNGRRGQRVVLQRFTGGRWTRVAAKRLSARRAAVFTVRRPARGGAVTYRLFAGPGAHHRGGASGNAYVPRA